MRLYPRIKTDIPLTIEEDLAKLKATISDLSADGAFLKGQFPTMMIGDAVFAKFHLPGYGLLEQNVRTIRKNPRGMAISFYNLDPVAKNKLWKYILEHLINLEECPYCGEKYGLTPQLCRNCGWRLEFNSPIYFEYHEKMFLLKKLCSKAENLNADQLRRMLHFLDGDILKGWPSGDFREFVGTSKAIREVFSNIRKVAPTDVSVLILGESGTGKELTALAIHERSMRKDNVFVPITCAAIPETLLEAELFGYERGAYTGAYRSKMGKFEYADGGTLFLDEIAELSPNLQAKLLRFLEDQIVERIGAIKGKKVNLRLIAATNCNIELAIAQGKFRPDLYYRLGAITIELPPVRERGEDKLLLANYFLKKFSGGMGVDMEFTEEAAKAIERFSWPGNVREIINKVRRGIVMSNDNFIKAEDLDLNVYRQGRLGERKTSLWGLRGKIEKQTLKEVLETCGNNISQAAKALGVSRPTIYSLRKRYGV